MRRLFMVLMTIALCACLFTGCDEAHASIWDDSGFTFIESKGAMDYIYHNETKVVYVFFHNYHQGGLSVLVNADGTPMIWEGN